MHIIINNFHPLELYFEEVVKPFSLTKLIIKLLVIFFACIDVLLTIIILPNNLFEGLLLNRYGFQQTMLLYCKSLLSKQQSSINRSLMFCNPISRNPRKTQTKWLKCELLICNVSLLKSIRQIVLICRKDVHIVLQRHRMEFLLS